jgi:hypothetical protein
MGMKHIIPQAFSSHPALDKRIARLQSKWKKLDRKFGFLELPPVTWPESTNSEERLFQLAIPMAATND